LHGKKEQFSDGVGYSWIDTLKEVVAKEGMSIINAKYKFRYKHLHPKKNITIVLFLLSISQ
jgi:hypothetical protein